MIATRAVFALLLTAALATPAFAGEWRIADYFPNPQSSAAAYVHAGYQEPNLQQRVGATRYFLYSWNVFAATGVFYQSVEEPVSSGAPCPGAPFGTHAGYGRPNSGYDWYAVDETGHHYLGWMYFDPNCNRAVGAITNPYGASTFPRSVNDAALPAPWTAAIEAQETWFAPDGTQLSQGPLATTLYHFEVVQPGGPGTLLGVKMSLPEFNWWMIDWFSDQTACGAAPCWNAAWAPEHSKGIWRSESSDASAAFRYRWERP